MCATAVEPITPESKRPRSSTRGIPPPSMGHRLRWIVFAAFAAVILVTVILGLVQKWLWMRELDYSGIFWTLLSIKWVKFGVAAVSAFLFLWINLRIAARGLGDLMRVTPSSKIVEASENAARRINIDLSSRLVVFVMDVAAIFVSVVFAISTSAQWDTYLRFRYQEFLVLSLRLAKGFDRCWPLRKVDLLRRLHTEVLRAKLHFRHYATFGCPGWSFASLAPPLASPDPAEVMSLVPLSVWCLPAQDRN
jgi:Uncharacterised protein family (UPF0182)